MDKIIILQFVIIAIVSLAIYKTGYFKGQTDERRKDIRPGQTTFDAGSDCDEGLRSCRAANSLHQQVERFRNTDDDEV